MTAEVAERVADAMQGLAAPSRVLILAQLRERPHSVTELVEAVGLEQPAVSHQLRLLKDIGLVVGERHGRRVVYSLYDSHVAELIDQAVGRIEHVRPFQAHGDRSPAMDSQPRSSRISPFACGRPLA